MHYRTLTRQDLYRYSEDVFKCYNDNRLILDSQNPLLIINSSDACNFVSGYIDGKDSLAVGIFDEAELFLYGIVIYDNMRSVDKLVAEVHIAISKEIWGRKVKTLFNEMLETSLFDILYCTIPQMAVNAIGMVKRLGFKKTGYIPSALPYINSEGKEKLYDLNIFCYKREI